METSDALIFQSAFLTEGLAAAIAMLTVPLLADLAVCIAGNLRRGRKANAEKLREIRLAVVVPAHDEEAMIARTVQSLLAAGCASSSSHGAGASTVAAWSVPVIVVAHNCTDRTAAVAAETGARVVELNHVEMCGKGVALRCGFELARAAGANAFLVVDADSVASPNLVAATKTVLERGAAATQCRYELELPASRPATSLERLRVLAFRGINVLRARGRAGLGFSAGVFGNGFGIADDTIQRVPFTVDSICEDLEYHIRLVVARQRVAWVEGAYVHAPLAPVRSAQAMQEARWEGGRFHVATRATGRLVAAMARGNWRAFEMLAEAWSLPISRGILALILAACLPAHWLHGFVIAGAALVIAYVLEAVFLGDNPWRDLAALAGAPLHILWKLAITPLVLRHSRGSAEWARTHREAQAP
ncbi:MAG TPA: glycosyltransferase family 2 protein [Terracidiphilus sp.]|nr:glycosyltransferase family 2 protein [Terracidiphilus sp.]